MADFATIVRPFQAVDVSYPRRIVKTGDAPPDNVVLTIGDNGGLKTLAYSRSYSMTTYMKKKQKEVVKPPAGQSNPQEYPGITSPGMGVPVRT